MDILGIIILKGTIISKSISTLQKWYGYKRQRNIEEISQTGGDYGDMTA